MVDWVVAFTEETPERLICSVLPDTLVKGGDYKPKEIAGYDCVVDNGGEVVVLDYHDGLSTSNTIRAIIDNSLT
jgi:D-beta-D-heptose 7-phosphate kinase/D-beta-D-heptose 1-phosphate adenosyltransferase